MKLLPRLRYDPPTPNDRPPSILFLMSDEHRADVAGFAGNAAVLPRFRTKRDAPGFAPPAGAKP